VVGEQGFLADRMRQDAIIRKLEVIGEAVKQLTDATRIGVTGHVRTKEQYETMRDAGAFDEDAITGATDAILSKPYSHLKRPSLGLRGHQRLQASRPPSDTANQPLVLD
jgi:hypothetical protein